MSELSTLEELRQELVRGLAAALLAGVAGELGERAVHGIAEKIVGGEDPGDDLSRFGDRSICALLGFDADGIHRWVFDSERVQVSAGASETLDKLNQHVGQRMTRLEGIHGVVYSAGGGGLLFADTRQKPRLLEERVQQWLESQSKGLRFTVVALPLCAADLLPGHVSGQTLGRYRAVHGVHGALVRSQIKMRMAKESRARATPPLVERKEGQIRAERCPSCGRRPPSQEPLTDTGPEFWCTHCQSLRAHRRFVDSENQPITFEQLAERIPRTRQYLGYIAIDGNSMGSVAQSIGGFLQLRAFSEAVTSIFSQARENADQALLPFIDGQDPKESRLSLLSGGDEITLVLPAAAAPTVAVEALSAIERGFDRETSRGGLLHAAFSKDIVLLDRLRRSGAGGGVIAAQTQYPVRLLRRYAEDLQKYHAKRYCAASAARSGLAWLLLTGSSPLTESLRYANLGMDLGLGAFERLLDEAAAAQRVRLPTSLLQNLVGQHRREKRKLDRLNPDERNQTLDLLTANFFRYQLARHDSLRNWWDEIEPKMGPITSKGDSVSNWLTADGGKRFSKLVDLLSLDPFPERAS